MCSVFSLTETASNIGSVKTDSQEEFGDIMLRRYVIFLILMLIFVTVNLNYMLRYSISYEGNKVYLFRQIQISGFYEASRANATSNFNVSALDDMARKVRLNETKSTARPDSCVSCFPNFRYIFHKSNVCSTEHPMSPTVKLLLLIFTTHRNVKNRDVLRKTWTSVANDNTAEVRYVFLLGKNDGPSWNDKAMEEAKQHGDIIIYDFKEVYNNLTLKTISGFQWAAGFCPNARYIMKTDDDMWVNTPKLLKDIDSWHIKKEVVGNCLSVASPIRDKKSKWYASPFQYPRSIYPGFCSGTGYVTTMGVVQAIVGVSPHIPYFHLEDVYVAICIRKLGYKLRYIKGFNRGKVQFNECSYKQIITSHYVSLTEVEKAWNANCSNQSKHSI